MTSRGDDEILTRRQEKELLRCAAEVARSSRPNPNRLGCPKKDALANVANRRMAGPELGAIVDHVANCSPCFAEYWRIRNRRRALQMSAAGLLIALVGAGVILAPSWLSQPKPSLTRQVAPPPMVDTPQRVAVPLAVVLDLRFSSRTRGEVESTSAAPVLPRGLLDLATQLPIGSEEGVYELAFYTSAERRSETVRGRAVFRNRMEVLEARVDTSALPPGLYELRLRPVGSAWMSFRVRLN